MKLGKARREEKIKWMAMNIEISVAQSYGDELSGGMTGKEGKVGFAPKECHCLMMIFLLQQTIECPGGIMVILREIG